jgi:hypothetical protein
MLDAALFERATVLVISSRRVWGRAYFVAFSKADHLVSTVDSPTDHFSNRSPDKKWRRCQCDWIAVYCNIRVTLRHRRYD